MFQNKHFQKKKRSQEHYHRVKQSGSAQERRFRGPDLGSKCLQRLAAAAIKDKVKGKNLVYRTDSYL